MDSWTRKELTQHGISRTRIAHLLAAQEAIRPRHGVYVRHDADDLAILQARTRPFKDAVVTGIAALWPRGLLPKALTAASAQEIKSRIPTLRTAGDITSGPFLRGTAVATDDVAGMRLAIPAQAVADSLTAEDVPEGILAEALAAHYKGIRGREHFETDMAKVKSRRKTQVRELARDAPVGAASKWERTIYKRLTDAGLEPVPNYKFGPYTWDFGFPKAATLVDLDSHAFHDPAENFETFLVGMWKSNHAVQRAWAPLKFSDSCTEYNWPDVLHVVRATVEHRLNARKSTPVKDAFPHAAWEFHESLRSH